MISCIGALLGGCGAVMLVELWMPPWLGRRLLSYLMVEFFEHLLVQICVVAIRP